MPQSRFRKEMKYGEKTPRSTYTSQASGDSAPCATSQYHPDKLTSGRNKIPRSVRYELENALIDLCDVWFDEIKPNLVRNNIKLHIPGNCCSASGDQACAPPAHHARRTPPAPPPPASPLSDACSHLDPGAARDRPLRGASYASSCSPQPAASSALRARLRMRLPCLLSPVISVPQTPPDGPQIQTHNSEKKPARPGARRKRRRFRAQTQPSWRVPRPCRALPTPCRAGASRSTSQLPPCDNYYRFIVPRRESVMKNKKTQTEPALTVSRGCQSHIPPGYRRPGVRSPGQRCPGPLNQNNSHISHAPRSRKGNPVTCNVDSSRPDHVLSPPVLPPPTVCQRKRSDVTVTRSPPLLQDDLIDIIAASNEKRLRLLYSSSEREDQPLFMNLHPICRPEKRLKKIPPWR
ncbi:hypothetical protein PYW07_007313 [Mythimna separata]|uniref:Uncharacterized protein n=1 Tax=Mythimna separata TaxID=271217 RepID=A0AAD7Z0V4_MYTSE|nr:hypothetical protein PYW07_007313 [Mythimna separata]